MRGVCRLAPHNNKTPDDPAPQQTAKPFAKHRSTAMPAAYASRTKHTGYGTCVHSGRTACSAAHCKPEGMRTCTTHAARNVRA